ncbi:MAG: transposon-encoded TnpW family protein [Oscillospiraceae bacterium]|nr:transposon-encoded TnpW family protein [Oscillospiraceae bacterium]
MFLSIFYFVPAFWHRKEFIIGEQHYTLMTRRFGNTNYRIKVYLSETATETFEDKVLRLVRNDSSLSCEELTHEKENKASFSS